MGYLSECWGYKRHAIGAEKTTMSDEASSMTRLNVSQGYLDITPQGIPLTAAQSPLRCLH